MRLLWLCGVGWLPPGVHGGMASRYVCQRMFFAIGQLHDVQIANSIAI
jgi:hypothetical protein